jgi:hypothetical protein
MPSGLVISSANRRGKQNSNNKKRFHKFHLKNSL